MSGSGRELLTRALRSIAPATKADAAIYLALSGGVDSSVAGLLLAERGWAVKPVLMRCWDDDSGEQDIGTCHEAELKTASAAAAALSLPEPEVFDFVKEYWTDVFDGVLLSGLEAGRTPNPDLACNRSVKFGAFPERLQQHAGTHVTPRFATGHYARLRQDGEQTTLLAAVDENKDQTYFLSSVPGKALRKACFPVGSLLKEEVRTIATYAGLPAATTRSSRGICFVGKRSMATFLERYLNGRKGVFIDADSGSIVAELPHHAHTYTTGQRARIGGSTGKAHYVLRRDGDNVLVVEGREHPKLYTTEQVCGQVDWVSGKAPDGLGREGIRLEYKSNSSARRLSCIVTADDGEGIIIQFERMQHIIVSGQAIVLYQGEVCLGAAWPSGQDESIQEKP
ncbi:unnamed protein product [Chondrus crispus]|uniref:tRNA-5-taurinomethyluridine 2-sulfurtransferase n=1 Tax=Chondrus crispus TaxID=2769 RepID=R7Q4A0_CHOCR|nr:unnamed protein product [Chondrus crispus]CDF32300.1 unnamed protein product [Chondrus crispus]|eukprot:XP_005711965.1 unnamed protein product [Chondrus crispus]